jgi:DNA invertase Pin-like site-specific DNA recombinase
MTTTEPEVGTAGTLPSSDRIEHAFAARESSMYSFALMEGMVTQTLAPHLNLPGVREVFAVGITPLTAPEQCPFYVHTLRAHRTNAATFAHEGSVYLYSLGTAAQVNTPEGDNAWMNVLIDFVRQWRPQNLYVANFNRLIRSALFSGELMKAFEATGTVLWANGIRIDLNDGQGRVLWQTLAMLSDLERESIVQRLFAGVVNKYRRGEWILTAEAVPAGYRLVDNRPLLDHDQVDAVRHLITLLADPTLSARQVVDAAGEIGLTSPTIQRVHGTEATYSDVRRADSKVRSLVRLVPTWSTGVYEARLPNPFRGVDHIGELQVVDSTPDQPHGFVAFTYELQVPEGGWGSADVLAAVARRTSERRRALNRGDALNGAAAHRRRRRPLAGWASARAQDGSVRFLSGDGTNYLVMHQDPAASGGDDGPIH